MDKQQSTRSFLKDNAFAIILTIMFVIIIGTMINTYMILRNTSLSNNAHGVAFERIVALEEDVEQLKTDTVTTARGLAYLLGCDEQKNK